MITLQPPAHGRCSVAHPSPRDAAHALRLLVFPFSCIRAACSATPAAHAPCRGFVLTLLEAYLVAGVASAPAPHPLPTHCQGHPP